MSLSTNEHRADAPTSVPCAVITVSDTRTLATDKGGALVAELLAASGHTVVDRTILPDESSAMQAQIIAYLGRPDVAAILLTGGTGISRRDQTYETISALLERPLPGYGELFRMLSYEEIGAAAMLSRAVGGVASGKIILTMPGSTAAVRLAMDKLICPELGHLVHEVSK